MAATWSSGGPLGGSVNVLARSASNPDVVYAGTNGGLYKSIDAGATWIKTGLPLFRVRSLAVAPNTPDVVYAGLDHGGPPVPTLDGIYRTNDGGTTWTPSGLAGARVNAAVIDPANPHIVYAGTGKPWSSYTGEITGVFKSLNSGGDWAEVLTGDIDAVAALLIDVENGSYVYAGTYGGDNFRKSVDGGATWVSSHAGDSGDPIVALTMESFPATGDPSFAIIYAAVAGDDIYQSGDSSLGEMDRGETGWTAVGGGAPRVSLNPPWFLVSDASDAPFIHYAGTRCDAPGCDSELFKRDPFDDAYPQWTIISSPASGLPLGSPSSVTVDPRDRSLLIGLAEAGIYKSTDRGDHWANSDHGLGNTSINGLAVDPGNPDTVFATVSADALRLAKSLNGGQTWEYLPNASTNLSAVAIDPVNPNRVWAGQGSHSSRNFYVFKSDDGGLKWASINFLTYSAATSTGVSDIIVNPVDSNALLIGTTGFDGVLVRTLDGGLNWHLMGFGTSALAVDPRHPGVVYQGTAQNGQVFQYSDVWMPAWTAGEITPPGGVGNVRDIAVDGASRVFVAASNGLWVRDGAQWAKTSGLATDDITALAIDTSSNPGLVFAGTGGSGVFASADGGISWSPLNDGLETLRITELRITTKKPKRLYAGTAGGGVWSRTADIITNGDNGDGEPDGGDGGGNGGGGLCFIAAAVNGL